MNFQSSLAAGLSGLLICAIGCAHSPAKRAGVPRGFEFTEPQMGVPFKIILYARDKSTAERAADAAFKRIAQINQIMSDYETDSELNELSRTSGQNREVGLSPDLWNILWKSQEIARMSHGAFDVTIGPCVSLWRKARREKQLPDPERLQKARARVGYTNLVLRPRNHSARLLLTNMHIDLGGIAKGYAADQALKTLASLGIPSAFVAASGDLAVGAPPPGLPGWRIGIAGYDSTNGPAQKDVYLRNCGISTSGDASQRVEIAGVRYSHILDPATCIGLTNHSLVTVIAPNCTTSDALATTLCILEPQAGLALAKRVHGKARIVRESGGKVLQCSSRAFDRIIASKSHPPQK